MSGAIVEVADVFRAYWDEYARAHAVPSSHKKVARDIMRCRTAELGGHLYRCADCSHGEQSYNSCRNRHCPKCQGSETARWVDSRTKELLPVPYFHTVFTLPDILNPLVRRNKRGIYELMFQAVRQTILELGRNNLGVTLGFFAVLHTWGQLLQLHPHIHCVIPACGLTPSGEVKVFSKRNLLPDKVLSAVFRGKFIQGLKHLYQKRELQIPDTIPDRDAFERLLSESCKSDWVVYSKAPFAGPEVVVKYLARYTHRVAIGNSRLLSIDNSKVTFTYRDYADDGAQKITSFSATHFLYRFLLHVVPKGFVRIRHYGFLSHAKKRAALPTIRAALLCGTSAKISSSNPHSAPSCPCCGSTRWFKLSELKPIIKRLHSPPSIASPPQV